MSRQMKELLEEQEELYSQRERAIAQNGNNGEHYETEKDTISDTGWCKNTHWQKGFSPATEELKVANSNRKQIPIYSGVMKYFPDAIREVAKCSYAGQQQHNPDKPLAWDRSKSGDELDALMRHLTDYSEGVEFDEDNVPHLAKVAWRALAALQKYVESKDE